MKSCKKQYISSQLLKNLRTGPDSIAVLFFLNLVLSHFKTTYRRQVSCATRFIILVQAGATN